MRYAFTLILWLFCLLTFAQIKIDTIPFSDIYFESLEKIDFNEFEVLDTLSFPDGFIVEGNSSKQVIINCENEFKIFRIPHQEMLGGYINISRQEIIEGGYEELIIKYTFRDGKSYNTNGFYITTESIEIFDLTNNKVIFSETYYDHSEEWMEQKDTSFTNETCDYCKEISIKKSEIKLTPTNNATDIKLETEIYLIQENRLIKKTIANNGYK
jgi:hypothetical protein